MTTKQQEPDQRGAVPEEGIVFTGKEKPGDGAAAPVEDTTDHPRGQAFTSPREENAGDEAEQVKRRRATARARTPEAQQETTDAVARRSR